MWHRLADPSLHTGPPRHYRNCFNLGEWIIVKIHEIILSSFNISLTQFGRAPFMSPAALLTSRTVGQAYLHLTGRFHLWAHKGVGFFFFSREIETYITRQQFRRFYFLFYNHGK